MKWVESKRFESDTSLTVIFSLYVNITKSRWNNSTSRCILKLTYTDKKGGINSQMNTKYGPYRKFEVNFSEFMPNINKLDDYAALEYNEGKYYLLTLEYAKDLSVNYLKKYIESIYTQLS